MAQIPDRPRGQQQSVVKGEQMQFSVMPAKNNASGTRAAGQGHARIVAQILD